MTLHRCITCGGDLKTIKNGVFQCMWCGNIQSLDNASDTSGKSSRADINLSAIAIENIYKSAVDAMANQKYDDAIRLLSHIGGYLDADAKLEHCQKMLIQSNNAEIYKNACLILASAKTAENYKTAANIFKQILDYKDSSALMSKCLSSAELLKNEEIYIQACGLMDECNIHFLQRAASIFNSIPTYKDSAAKYRECLALIENQKRELDRKHLESQRRKRQAARKKRITVLTILFSIIALIVTVVTVQKLAHSVKGIDIEIVDTKSVQEERYYYVYTDYKITNNTAQTIDYLEVVTYVTDQNGKSLGTITSHFGSSYGSEGLNLKANQSTIQEIYLSEYQSDRMDSLFVTLYNNGIEDFIVTHEITNVRWSDGYTYTK